MASRFKTQEDFLNHSGSMEGNRGNFLKNWKKKGHVDPKDPDTRYIDVWLHTICVPQRRWSHGWHRIEVRENKETKRVTKEVWGDDFVCHEEESVLKKQYKRTDDDQREAFPEYCPSCRLNEVVYQLVTTGKFVYDGKVIAKGKLSWTEPLFVYEGSDSSKKVVLHAAGLYNGFKDVAANSDEAAALRDFGIYPKTAWRENTNAKLTYLFALVENSEIAKGIQITEETQLLGEKVRQVIAKSRESLSAEDGSNDNGNPFKVPFAIRWKYTDKEGLAFDKRYDALKIENVKLPMTDEIEALIKSAPRDWFAHKLAPGDSKTFRSVLERHATEAATKIIPWDWIFDCAPIEQEESPTAGSGGSPESEEAPPPKKAAGRTKVSAGKAAASPPPKEPEKIPCDDCGTMMLATASKCPKCGAEYAVNNTEVVESPPPKAAPKNGATVGAGKPVVAAKKSVVEPDDDDEDEDQEIPF